MTHKRNMEITIVTHAVVEFEREVEEKEDDDAARTIRDALASGHYHGN